MGAADSSSEGDSSSSYKSPEVDSDELEALEAGMKGSLEFELDAR